MACQSICNHRRPQERPFERPPLSPIPEADSSLEKDITTAQNQDDERRRRVEDFVSVAESSSTDVLHLYYQLTADFDDIDADLPHGILAIVQSLLANLPFQRDGPRSVQGKKREVCWAWKLSVKEFDDFFGSLVLSRRIIAALKQLSSRVDFTTASKLLRDAQDRRRDRTGGVNLWKGTMRFQGWVLGDFQHALDSLGPKSTSQQQGSEEEALEDVPEEVGESGPYIGRVRKSLTISNTGRKMVRGAHTMDEKQLQASPGSELISRAIKKPLLDDTPLERAPKRQRSECRLSTPELFSSPIEHGRHRLSLSSRGWDLDVSVGDGEDVDLAADPPTKSLPQVLSQEAILTVEMPGDDDFAPLHERSLSPSIAESRDEEHDGPVLAENNISSFDEAPALSETPGTDESEVIHAPQVDPVAEVVDLVRDGASSHDDLDDAYPLDLKSLDRLGPRTWLDDETINSLITIFLTGAPPQSFVLLDSLTIKRDRPLTELESRAIPTSLLLPLHLEASAHWTLVVIHRDRDVIDFYDSLPSDTHFQQAGAILSRLAKKLLPSFMSASTWTLVRRMTPRQNNSYDCGLYVVITALYLITGRSIPARPLHGPCWRHILSTISDVRLQQPRTATPWRDSALMEHPLPVLDSVFPGPSLSTTSLQVTMGHVQQVAASAQGALTTANKAKDRFTEEMETLTDACDMLNHLSTHGDLSTHQGQHDIHIEELTVTVGDLEQQQRHLQQMRTFKDCLIPHETLDTGLETCVDRLLTARKDIARLNRAARQRGEGLELLRKMKEHVHTLRDHVRWEEGIWAEVMVGLREMEGKSAKLVEMIGRMGP